MVSYTGVWSGEGAVVCRYEEFYAFHCSALRGNLVPDYLWIDFSVPGLARQERR